MEGDATNRSPCTPPPPSPLKVTRGRRGAPTPPPPPGSPRHPGTPTAGRTRHAGLGDAETRGGSSRSPQPGGLPGSTGSTGSAGPATTGDPQRCCGKAGAGCAADCGRAGRDPPPRDGSGHKKKKNVRIKESTVPSSGSRDSQLQASMGRPSSRAPITPHSSSPRSPLLLTPSHCSGAAGQGRPPPRHRHCEIQVLPPRSAPVLGNFCFHLGQVVLHGDQNSAGAELEIQHFPLLAAVK